MSQCHQVLVQEPEGARQGQTGPNLGGGARIPPQGPWTRSRARPGVHVADVNPLRCRYARRGSLEFCGLFSACDACAVLKSAVWTPTTYQYDLPSLSHRIAASGRPAPSRGPVRASVSEVMTLACLRSEGDKTVSLVSAPGMRLARRALAPGPRCGPRFRWLPRPVIRRRT